jgi:hypothetical protein
LTFAFCPFSLFLPFLVLLLKLPCFLILPFPEDSFPLSFRQDVLGCRMRGRQQVRADRERWVPLIPQHVRGQLRVQSRGWQVVGNGVWVVMQGVWAEKRRRRGYNRRVVRLGQSEGLSLRHDGRGTTS